MAASDVDGRTLSDLLLRLSARLTGLLEEEIDAGVDEALGLVAAASGADRVYVMTFDHAAQTFSNSHEWVAAGVSAEREQVQGRPLAWMEPWLASFFAGEAVAFERLDALPASAAAVRDALAAQAVRSVLWVPMPGPRSPLGFVGFDAVHAQRRWSPMETDLLRAAGNLIAAALARRLAATERDLASARLRAIADLVPGAVYQFQVEPDGRVCFPYASVGVRALFGVEPEALREDGEVVFQRIHHADLPGLRASIERSRQDLAVWSEVFRVRDGTEAERWVRGHATPERLASGVTLWHGVVSDVTERVAQQQRLEREAAFRTALVGLTNDMLAQTLDERFYQQVLERAIELVPEAQGGSLVLQDDDGLYRFVAAAGFDLDALATLRLTNEEIGARSPSVERISIHDTQRRLSPEGVEVFVQAGRLHEIRATLSVPITAGGVPRGYMNLDNFDDDDAFLGDSHGIAEALTAQVGIALQRLQLERDLEAERRRYERLASHDPLTGLPNRRLFQDRLEQALTQAHRRRSRVALLNVDLDGFKDVNDTLGHDVGDELLAAVAARLVAAVRAEDTVARLGGDEFAVVLPGVCERNDASLVAQKLLEAIDTPFELRGRTVLTGASVGIAVYPHDARLTDGLMKAADVAMYRVKQQGKGAYAFFDAAD